MFKKLNYGCELELYFLKCYDNYWKVFMNLEEAMIHANGGNIIRQKCETGIIKPNKKPIYVIFTEQKFGNRVFRFVSSSFKEVQKHFEENREKYCDNELIITYEINEYKFVPKGLNI